jgi:ergothioneine biosynthesis protein EgtB
MVLRDIESTTGISPSQTVLLEWYRRNRERSRMLFELVADSAYESRPIPLRHPVVFYEGHMPAFSFNTLVKKALGGQGIDERLETLFARGIDPPEPAGTRGPSGHDVQWPSREVVRSFTEEADRRVIDALSNEELDRPGDPLLDRTEAAFAILEHEAMHHETLLYLFHRLPYDLKKRPAGPAPQTGGPPPPAEWVEVPEGSARLGAGPGSIPFGWDNEFPSWSVRVPAFWMERHDVTNARYLEFVEAGGYRDPRWWRAEDWEWLQREGIAHPLFWERREGAWYWRGMFEPMPLPPALPVYASFAEAAAFARWNGARLPTEAEFHRAAYGSAEGMEERRPAGVSDFESWDPLPAGSRPEGASPWGIEDLVGNGWEWTSTPFAPFPGFRAMASYPEYSADFFDGQHYVMKGASPATARELVRPSFRNWFRARYPYVYATFRCVKDGSGRT